MEKRYKKTIYACFTGYIVQAIVNNFVPLLFMTFEDSFQIPLDKITALITINFSIQLLVDLLSAGFVDRVGYRPSIIMAHVFAAAGLGGLVVLPELFPTPFSGLLASVILYAIGGGLIEVLISPIMESCPTENKEKAMSLLHSFYCWGHVGVVLLSTVFFKIFGVGQWKILTFFWLLIPIANGLVFSKTPVTPLAADGETGLSMAPLLKDKVFWVLMLLMMGAGASEQGISQWASTFAEKGLGVSKTLGDLAGPMAFAGFMGTARAFYGKYGDHIDLDRFMLGSGVMCVLSYLCVSLSPSLAASLMGCAMCGLSVGIMWPGTFSKASSLMKNRGTAMYALLALGGDLGCAVGPGLVGCVSSAASGNLKTGILAGAAFPVLMILGTILVAGKSRKNRIQYFDQHSSL